MTAPGTNQMSLNLFTPNKSMKLVPGLRPGGLFPSIRPPPKYSFPSAEPIFFEKKTLRASKLSQRPAPTQRAPNGSPERRSRTSGPIPPVPPEVRRIRNNLLRRRKSARCSRGKDGVDGFSPEHHRLPCLPPSISTLVLLPRAVLNRVSSPDDTVGYGR